MIGAGTYADDRSCAVSTTGHGEWFLRTVQAYDIAARLRYGGSVAGERGQRGHRPAPDAVWARPAG